MNHRTTATATVENPDRSTRIDALVVSNDALAPSVWSSYGLCKGRTSLFFAPPGERSQRRAKREALAASYCARCPVRTVCQEWARENREAGFWGGESEEERASAGYPPRSPNRRFVAELGRAAANRERSHERAS